MATKAPFFRALAFAATVLISSPVAGQDVGIARTLILTIDSDRVYASSVAGQNITKDIENRLTSLVAENRRIEAELEAEEKDLTEKRAGLEPSAFRALADTFDAKVRRIRAEQDTKQQELQKLRDEDRRAFVGVIAPILSQIGNERGAIVILERRDVLLSADSIDITDEAIARINAEVTAEQPTEEPPAQENDSDVPAEPNQNE